MGHPKRYVRVPWGLIRQTDLQPKGEPETLIDAPHMRILGLLVTADDWPLPGGYDYAMLAIRAVDTDEPGGTITMAIAESLPMVQTPIHMQRNPVRHVDGYSEDDAA